MYQQLAKLGSLELQAVLNRMLDEVATPIKFCQYKLHGPSGADDSLKVPDSPSGKLIQVLSACRPFTPCSAFIGLLIDFALHLPCHLAACCWPSKEAGLYCTPAIWHEILQCVLAVTHAVSASGNKGHSKARHGQSELSAQLTDPS